MAQLSKSAFLAKWLTIFADNVTRDISEEDMRDFRQDIADSFWNKDDDALTSVQTAQADTSGATITLDFDSGSDYVFVGSASFATAKTIALDNDTNALRLVFLFQITNVAATLTFPSSFTMSDALWNSSSQVWTALDTGKFKARAEFDGTNWHMEITGPYS